MTDKAASYIKIKVLDKVSQLSDQHAINYEDNENKVYEDSYVVKIWVSTYLLFEIGIQNRNFLLLWNLQIKNSKGVGND